MLTPRVGFAFQGFLANLESTLLAYFTRGTMKHSKLTILRIALALSVAPSAHAQAADQNASHLIRPGESIGRTHLGTKGGLDLKKLPQPDLMDSYTSHSVRVWISKKAGRTDTLFIKTVNNGALGVQPLDGVSIELIRVTSPWYRTPNGLSTGNTFAQIRREFPDARPVDNDRKLYDDIKRGIAFEFARSPTADSPCFAVMVHPRGEQRVASAEEVENLLREGHHP
jgi:hypothetical protein